MPKKIRFVSVEDYTDVTYYLTRIHKKQVARKGQMFMVITSKRFHGEKHFIKSSVEYPFEIPNTCTEEQTDILLNKFIEVRKDTYKGERINDGK